MGALDVSKTCPFHRQPTATSDTSSFTGALEPKTRAQRRQDPANQVSPVFGCEIKINTNTHTHTDNRYRYKYKYIYIHVGHDLGLPRYFVWHSSLKQAQALISHPVFGFPIAPVPTYSSMVSRDEPQPCPFKDRRSWRLKSCAGEQLAIKQPEPAIHKVHQEKLRHLSARPSTSKSPKSSASSSSSYFTKM